MLSLCCSLNFQFSNHGKSTQDAIKYPVHMLSKEIARAHYTKCKPQEPVSPKGCVESSEETTFLSSLMAQIPLLQSSVVKGVSLWQESTEYQSYWECSTREQGSIYSGSMGPGKSLEICLL